MPQGRLGARPGLAGPTRPSGPMGIGLRRRPGRLALPSRACRRLPWSCGIWMNGSGWRPEAHRPAPVRRRRPGPGTAHAWLCQLPGASWHSFRRHRPSSRVQQHSPGGRQRPSHHRALARWRHQWPRCRWQRRPPPGRRWPRPRALKGQPLGGRPDALPPGGPGAAGRVPSRRPGLKPHFGYYRTRCSLARSRAFGRSLPSGSRAQPTSSGRSAPRGSCSYALAGAACAIVASPASRHVANTCPCAAPRLSGRGCCAAVAADTGPAGADDPDWPARPALMSRSGALAPAAAALPLSGP
jgi:hypothetical protein